MSDEKPKKTATRKPRAKKSASGESAEKKSLTETLEPFLDKVQENFIGANFIAVIKKWKIHEGRASRREFWLFVLGGVIISIALSILSSIPVLGWLFRLVYFLYGLALIIPSVTVGIRRLHDTNKTGWLMLLLLIPIVGWIPVLILCALEGTKGKNNYGPEPKD
jgi:uncharacterized membrane protein YhaH (DUF805 family)